MSAAPSAGRPRVMSAATEAMQGRALDLLTLAALALLLFAAVVWRFEAVPLQLWDESRNAENALEVALSGHWLVPSFSGVPDHWNTKPPLLIWLMAAGLKAGLPPLLALRLPSWGAAAATVAAVWSALRFGLRDRLAAAAGGALVLSSLVFIGAHAARTGDFDALESLFVTGYVLCGWAALDAETPRRFGWVAATAACALLAVMSKGVAGLLATPGLVLFAASRPGALAAVLRDLRTWALGAAALAGCAGYYLAREHADPGYLRAVFANEVGGRFMSVSDNHRGGPAFYLQVLARRFEPGLALLPATALPLLGHDARRRGLVLASGLSGLALLLVLSAARSKLDWYATPAVPLFAAAAAVGASDLARWARRRAPGLGRLPSAALLAGLGAACVMAAGLNQTARTTSHGDLDGPQFGYAALFNHIEAARAATALTAVDEGFANAAGFPAYNPVLDFYARRETARGLPVQVRGSAAGLGPGMAVASCDPWAEQALRDTYHFTLVLQMRGCVLIRLTGRL